MDWQYSVKDRSLTTKILNPFWNWMVSLVPTYVAPNVLTMGGLICIIYVFMEWNHTRRLLRL
jgi:ethanolaminephosphotransferase